MHRTQRNSGRFSVCVCVCVCEWMVKKYTESESNQTGIIIAIINRYVYVQAIGSLSLAMAHIHRSPLLICNAHTCTHEHRRRRERKRIDIWTDRYIARERWHVHIAFVVVVYIARSEIYMQHIKHMYTRQIYRNPSERPTNRPNKRTNKSGWVSSRSECQLYEDSITYKRLHIEPFESVVRMRFVQIADTKTHSDERYPFNTNPYVNTVKKSVLECKRDREQTSERATSDGVVYNRFAQHRIALIPI